MRSARVFAAMTACFVAGMLSCSSYTGASFTYNPNRHKVRRITAIWIPFNMIMQSEVDGFFRKVLGESYVEFYSLYKPLEQWSGEVFEKRLDKAGVDSVLFIGPFSVIDLLPSTLFETLIEASDYEQKERPSFDYFGANLYETLYGEKIVAFQIIKDLDGALDNFPVMFEFIRDGLRAGKVLE